MRVADFFCGAGGFSEGFRQAGFDIVFAVDKWNPAVVTHTTNHPNSKTILGDVEKISNLPEEEFHNVVPDTEIIIGSPPCVAFSNSNKSGKADKSLGILLLESYLRIVARKKFKKDSVLKYWVLENVPNINKYLKKTYSFKDLGLQGDYKLKVINDSSNLYNAKYFGVASNRIRFFCGEFPEPKKIISDSEVVKLGYILKSLGGPKENTEEIIFDPNGYDLHVKSKNITDYHYIKEIAEFEWKKAKRQKQDKGYMGRMSFPEDLKKPARTVMATMSFSSRESMILSYKKGKYRAPTVREVASIMSFPLDYMFCGTSIAMKYKLVGNAVPPKMAYAIAKTICYKEGLNLPIKYIPINHDENLNFHNLNFDNFEINIEKRKNINAKFKYHIPYMLLNGYRVELTNYNSDFNKQSYKWSVEIHKSQGKGAKKYTPKIDQRELNIKYLNKVNKFIKKIKKDLTSFDKFQEIYCLTALERKDILGPEELLFKIKSFIEDLLTERERRIICKYNNYPYDLPQAISIGYYVLSKIIIIMEGLKDESRTQKKKAK